MIKLIGVGHRAQNGKDTFANMFVKEIPNSLIVHWADDLKEELSNTNRDVPLIQWTQGNFVIKVDEINSHHTFRIFAEELFPSLTKIMTERGITEYWGMDEKDSPMLQFWGTDLRRTYYGYNYWVDKTIAKIEKLNTDNNFDFAIIPDTRFHNERDAVKARKGIYVRIRRYNIDGTPFYDISRSKDHPSECDLEGIAGDFDVKALSGDFNIIQSKVREFARTLLVEV